MSDILKAKDSLAINDLFIIFEKLSHNKTEDHASMEILDICKLDVLTPDNVIFPEKSEDRFVISIHSSVHLKNTSEITRFGRVVVIHEFIELPVLEFHVKSESHERTESHDKNESSDTKNPLEKSEFSIPDQSRFHVKIGDK